MKWIGNRISFNETKERTTIVIEPQRNGLVNSLMGAWLAMWYVIGIATFVYSMDHTFTEKEQVIIWVFFVFWVYYAVRVTRSYLWLMFGKELIKIDEVGLHYKRSIRKFGKSTLYLFGNIQDLQFDVPEESSVQRVWESSPWINGGERFTFSYFGKIVKFGRKLEEKDCKLLYTLVSKRIQERKKK